MHAFRQAEKVYRYKNGAPPDLSDVEFAAEDVKSASSCAARVLPLDHICPGLVIVRGALDAQSQRLLALYLLRDVSHQRGVRSNLSHAAASNEIANEISGDDCEHISQETLVASALGTNRGTSEQQRGTCAPPRPSLLWDDRMEYVRLRKMHWRKRANASSVLRKTRWLTLGYHYGVSCTLQLRLYKCAPNQWWDLLVPSSCNVLADWTARSYSDTARGPIPRRLADLCTDIARACNSKFVPEAAIVNFYHGKSDTLCGHLDDVEETQDRPIVSISLGLNAIFLIGGTTRDVLPRALLLRSGDALLMAGESRRRYHGVPCVLDDTFLAAGEDELPSQLPGLVRFSCEHTDAEVQDVEALLSYMRVNVNMRQVH